MKRWIKRTLTVALAAFVLYCGVKMGREKNQKETDVMSEVGIINYEYMKAMWLSQYDLKDIYTDAGRQRDREDFTLRIEKVVDNVVSLGINTVIVQVRPFADSFYPSELYPISSFITGSYGKEADYDPFEIILAKCHCAGLSVHAWINPLRCMTEKEINDVPRGYKIREWYDEGKCARVVSGRVYLDPAHDEVRDLISSGAAEIVRLYDVDGIHMDDYFYPTTDESFDSSSYEDYLRRGGRADRAQFRRDNVNLLVREIYSAVKAENPMVVFGISPAGVMKNNYEKLYADVYEWCGSDGYIDYICPQVYFGLEHDNYDFIKVCREFSDMIKSERIRLIIGMTLGKAVSEYDPYAGNGKYEWRDNKDILRRELEYSLELSKCSGVSYFCYQYFFDPLTGREITAAAEERRNLIPALKSAGENEQ